MPANSALAEADRLMTICNSCRYCEGLCPVFPAMEMHRSFSPRDLNYLANLCHGCGACYDDCQFAPPHEFDVNLPKALARLRGDSYAAWAWPPALAGTFRHNALALAIALAGGVAAFVIGIAASSDSTTIFAAQGGAGAFYRVVPHGILVAIFAAAFVAAAGALFMSARLSWRSMITPGHSPSPDTALWQAIKAAATLRYLDGGGSGCTNGGGGSGDRRRLYHHFTAYGFLLCAASTAVATLYHYLLGREAPYAWYDLPVVLGSVGGAGLLVGPVGLLTARWRRDPSVIDAARSGMDVGFVVMLFLTGLTGLLLLVLRATSAMGILLAIHLGAVLALFLTLPYGKFVHAVHRFLALVRYQRERSGSHGKAASAPT